MLQEIEIELIFATAESRPELSLRPRIPVVNPDQQGAGTRTEYMKMMTLLWPILS